MQLDLKPDFDRAKQLILDLHARGIGNTNIAQQLNRMGYRTLKGYKFKKGYVSHLVSKLTRNKRTPTKTYNIAPKPEEPKIDLNRYLISSILENDKLCSDTKVKVLKELLGG